MKVTTGIRQIIEDWHTKGVSPEFLEPHLPALEEPANIGDNRKES